MFLYTVKMYMVKSVSNIFFPHKYISLKTHSYRRQHNYIYNHISLYNKSVFKTSNNPKKHYSYRGELPILLRQNYLTFYSAI
jgi:hypothetical protein